MVEAILKVAHLDENGLNLLIGAFSEQHLVKGEPLLTPGSVCKHVYFLRSGLLRSFYVHDGDERNVAFATDNSFLTDLKSLRLEQPTELTIQALETSTVLRISRTGLVNLYGQSHQIEAFGRNLLEMMLAEQEEYGAWFRIYSAEERYTRFVQKRPDLVQRLSLGQIASFLGVRRETLSRVRSRR